MKNPFLAFRSVPVSDEGNPPDRIMADHQSPVQQLLNTYRNLLEGPAKELAWYIDHTSRMNYYKAILKGMEFPQHVKNTLAFAEKVYHHVFEAVQHIPYDVGDIEDLCALMSFSPELSKNELRPAGVYISALVNASRKEHIVLKLPILQHSFNFLGFKLPTGKTLLFEGSAGDFTGAKLCGGFLHVEGPARNWCGIAMEQGEILITKDTGQKTGELMTGGKISVQGSILGIAKSRVAGEIYQKGKPVPTQ